MKHGRLTDFRYWKRKWPGDHRVLLSDEDCGGGDGACGQSILNTSQVYSGCRLTTES